MIKEMLEQKLGQPITAAEFAVVMEITTDDIKFNRMNFKKKTNLNELLDIAERSSIVFKRTA